MEIKTIKLYDKAVHPFAADVTLEAYIHTEYPEITKKPRNAIIVFPGGGYEFTSRREAECIADVYFAAGFNAFVCNYTVGKDKCCGINPLLDAAAAVLNVRRNAAEYKVNPSRIAVIGFSAGAHLAGHIATSWRLPELSSRLGAAPEELRPNALILCYPVISGIDHPHEGSFDTLLGADRTYEQTKAASLETLVTSDCPSTFIWTTSDDEAVPSRNALLFAAACAEAHVQFELHVFPHGLHGISLATDETNPDWATEKQYASPYIARWAGWTVEWLEGYGYPAF